MPTVDSLEKRIEDIEIRNQRVEIDKAWERSLTRRLLLMFFTYLAVGFYLSAIQVPAPWVNAIVPAVAFMLSTLTMPVCKRWWVRFQKRAR